LKNIYKAANKYNLDPRKLIIESSKKNVINVPEELVTGIQVAAADRTAGSRTDTVAW